MLQRGEELVEVAASRRVQHVAMLGPRADDRDDRALVVAVDVLLEQQALEPREVLGELDVELRDHLLLGGREDPVQERVGGVVLLGDRGLRRQEPGARIGLGADAVTPNELMSCAAPSSY